MVARRDIKPALRAIARELAKQLRDGQAVSEATVADLDGVARGEINTDELTRRIYQRLGIPAP